MSEYSHCSICGGSFVGIGNVCPGCEDALSREPLEIRPVERKTWRTDAFSRALRRELATVKIHLPTERAKKEGSNDDRASAG